MARNYKQAQAPKVDAVTMSDWFREWHPVWYAVAVFMIAWLGPQFSFIPALSIAILFFAISQAVRGYQWRKQRIAILAEQGIPDPGIGQMFADWKTELRRLQMVRQQFAVACRTNKIQGEAGNKRVPFLRALRTTADMDVQAEVVTAGGNGVTIDQIIENATSIAEVSGAKSLVVRRTKSVGHAELTWYFTDPIERVLRLSQVPNSPKGTLAYGVRQDGSPAWIWQHESVLIGGLTRKGKSVLIRALLADCIKKGIYVDLFVGDTKDGIQMSEYSKHIGERMGTVRVVDYQTTVKGVEAMFKRMVAEKAKRGLKMVEQGIDQHTPSEEEPLMVAIIDETLPLFDMLKNGHKTDAGNIAFSGAAMDCVIWANAQLGDKNAIGDLRDLIPQAICFATKTWQQADAVLGSNATKLGVACHQIGDVPGVGWSGSNSNSGYEKFRSANVTKAESLELAVGKLPEYDMNKVIGSDKNEWYALYRAKSFPDATGGRQLLYIGKTNSPKLRFQQHADNAKKPWWGEKDDPANEVDYADLYDTLVWYPSEREVLKQERNAIINEKPLYNVIHNQDNPARRTAPKGPVVVSKAEKKRKPVRPAKPARKPKAEKKVIQKKSIWPLYQKPIKKTSEKKIPVNGKKSTKVWGA